MSSSSTNGDYTQTNTDFSSFHDMPDEEKAATRYLEDQQRGKIDWEELQYEVALAKIQDDFEFDDSQSGSNASTSNSG